MESDNNDSRIQQLTEFFTEITAEDVLTSISKTQLINIDDDYDTVLQIIKTNIHSSYPVYKDGIDDIVGILHISDLLINTSPFNLNSLLQYPIFVSENTNVLEIFEEFNKKNQYIALVVDEHGAVRGILTQHDIISGIFQKNTSDTDIDTYIQKKDSQIFINTDLTISNFNKKFNTEFICKDCDSIGGFVIENFTYVPEIGESIIIDNIKVTVSQIEGAKLREIIVEFI